MLFRFVWKVLFDTCDVSFVVVGTETTFDETELTFFRIAQHLRAFYDAILDYGLGAVSEVLSGSPFVNIYLG